MFLNKSTAKWLFNLFLAIILDYISIVCARFIESFWAKNRPIFTIERSFRYSYFAQRRAAFAIRAP